MNTALTASVAAAALCACGFGAAPPRKFWQSEGVFSSSVTGLLLRIKVGSMPLEVSRELPCAALVLLPRIARTSRSLRLFDPSALALRDEVCVSCVSSAHKNDGGPRRKIWHEPHPRAPTAKSQAFVAVSCTPVVVDFN